ncbi:NADPH-dependent F420 reductase [Natronobacterium gregoryi]|uniref:NADPH-dependent F420 reductase n=2 Tax=Natronobacterium gregoryi TaxID=44930 RepID=L0AHD4_NATGS|nr:NADPH-dependent F420 reductase [Natronobacterium gregoryi]AFZ73201.1 NADPH-dependent F420 reductase [Natronobacterium gregoryi SP2]ELY71341.1 NADPH-dependent F420 reductase [Natronobacterium gregoryi SP2]PLK21610.1 NADPH-dependent F420 reductase [Natronobacterium gregoryi SP2]SFI58563.1 reduced coenzyme F420:NADP oxidoreductase [Natronobacterium gregoryi]
MRIALLGGTGDIGEGLALRFGRDTDHEILIGSRDPEKARDAVESYGKALERQRTEANVKGFANEMAADRADVAVLAVPPYHVGDTVETVADNLDADTILVSPAVGMQGDEDGLHYHPPGVGSVTELVAQRAPDEVPVIGAFHNLAAGKLTDLEVEFDLDTLVVGDDEDAKKLVRDLANEIEGLRALDAGPLANSAEVESVTPLVINIAKYNDEMEDVGVNWV